MAFHIGRVESKGHAVLLTRNMAAAVRGGPAFGGPSLSIPTTTKFAPR